MATHALHQALDRNLPLAHADATMADYAVHLCVLRDWQAALTPWLSRTGQTQAPLALITADLVDCAAAGISILPPAALDLTQLKQADDGSEAFCWGMAYVLEGSRLGGQMLYRRLKEALAPHPLRFLSERGATGPAWPRFLATLREKLGEAEACDAGCEGATAAFEALLAHFRRQGALA